MLRNKLLGLITILSGIVLSVSAVSSHAALFSGTTLSFVGDETLLSNTRPVDGSGSWFSLQFSPAEIVYIGINSYDGLTIDSIQPASGTHSGPPDGSESPGIDNPWMLLGQTGMHQTTEPITVMSDDGLGNVLLDFSGWEFLWNGSSTNLGSGAWAGNQNGIAVLKCQFDCSDTNIPEAEYREWFVLDYSATITMGTSLGGVTYQLHLESIDYVPVPAAIWLFGSGLIGLVGFCRQRKAV